jgi:peptide/nickel transport system substrate-binding protein
VATDQDERAELYKEMQVIVQEDAPWVFVANWKQNAVTSDRVRTSRWSRPSSCC